MIKILADSAAVYFLLESAGVLFSDFTIDHVLAFDDGDHFHLVIYTSGDRNFTCFTAENYLQETDALPALIETVQEYSMSDKDALREKALKIIEDKLHSNNARFYFDAH